MVVTYKVSYSNNNDPDEFLLIWNAPNSVNKIFRLFLKNLFNFKNHQVLMMHPVFKYNSALNTVVLRGEGKAVLVQTMKAFGEVEV